MNKRYEDHEYPFGEIDEIDEDGFTNFFDIEYMHNTDIMNSNRVYPPKGSYTHVPTNEFAYPGAEVEETIKALNKLNEYDNK